MGKLIDWLVENEPAFRKSRLPSLYSDLVVQKSANAEGYAANVSAWQSALIAAAAAGESPSGYKLVLESSDQLLEALTSSQYGKPSGLGLVLDDSVKSGKMVSLQDFLAAKASIYHHTWIPSPWDILKWGIRQTGIVGTTTYEKSGHLRRGQLVLVPVLEQLSEQIVAMQGNSSQSLTGRLMTKDAFIEELKSKLETSLSHLEVNVLLLFLSRDKQILSFDDRTVKFKTPAADTPDPLTEEDATIASLKSLISNLEKQIASLDQRIEGLRKSALEAVKKKNKTSAMSALRSKNLAEKTLQHRSDTLHQLEAVYTKIEEAVDQVQMIEVIQASTKTLRGLNKRIGDVDRVQDVMDDLRQQIEKADDTGQILQEPLNGETYIDEVEIDEELQAMEKEEQRVHEEKEADMTRRRLAELDGTLREQQDEQELKSSIEKLQSLDLKSHEDSREKTERVVEQAFN